jgi:hypothetical protein
MKSGPKISLLLNLVLAGGLIYLLVAGRRPVPVSPQPVVAAPPPAATEVSAPQVSPPREPAPFRWCQLDSSDYHIYVKNLRAIGCPAPSLRAIVTADVQAVLGQRRRALEKKLADLDGGSLASQLGSFNAVQAIHTELQKLPDTETRLIADLLGLTPAPSTQPEMPPLPNGPAVLPLALQPVDLAAMNLDDQQIKTLDDMRQIFLNKIGDANQNPADPDYLERWNKAQSEADDMTKGFIGNTAYQNLQLQALAMAQAQPAGNPQ